MIKRLASLRELRQESFARCVDEINRIARQGGLLEYTTYSRIWEYPWVWFQLEPLATSGLHVLDVGSEMSPFPWFLAARGFNVTVSDVTAQWWGLWRKAARRLEVSVQRRVFDACRVDLPAASVDAYLSISVIEHVPDKRRAIDEAARVLRPGGLLVTTFDVCEPDMGMTFPAWNGRALTMREFDDMFRNSPWFEPGLADLAWNTEDIPDYLIWHRATAPHHNYVTAGAAIRRSGAPWTEAVGNVRWRALGGRARTAAAVASWYLRRSPLIVWQRVRRGWRAVSRHTRPEKPNVP
jgi:SAM-dependent methyltransferase